MGNKETDQQNQLQQTELTKIQQQSQQELTPPTTLRPRVVPAFIDTVGGYGAGIDDPKNFDI